MTGLISTTKRRSYESMQTPFYFLDFRKKYAVVPRTAMKIQTNTPAIANSSNISLLLLVVCFTVSQNGKLFKGFSKLVDIISRIPYSKDVISTR